MESKLTFWQRHFTRPVAKDPEKHEQGARKFSVLSKGFILSIVVSIALLAVIIVPSATLTLSRKPRPRHTISRPQDVSPIRAAIMDNFPDPTIWQHGGMWYAFATNDAAGILHQPRNVSQVAKYARSNVQIATSQDFFQWELQNYTDDPLPMVGRWANQQFSRGPVPLPLANVWAPGLIQRPLDGKFVMYYTAQSSHNTFIRLTGGNLTSKASLIDDKVRHHGQPHCIGASVSDSGTPAGPYAAGNATIACPALRGGAIDPAPFVDLDGTLWLAYKIDGNSLGHGGECGNTVLPLVPTPILLQKMNADGLTTEGEPIQILDREPEDGPLVEAPFIVRSAEGKYFLFFSSGCTRDPDYTVKYAVAEKITGPYKRSSSPLLQTGDWGLLAPGSVGLHPDGQGGWNMAFHARVSTLYGKVRAMFTTKLMFNGTSVHMYRDTE